MKKSFTLIEVMISVSIIFMVVSVVLAISSNTKKLFNHIQKNTNFAYKASVSTIENKDTKNVYEKLIDFNITNDKIIHTLKQDIQHKKISQKTIHSFIDLQINNIKIYNNKNNIYLYGVKIK